MLGEKETKLFIKLFIPYVFHWVFEHSEKIIYQHVMCLNMLSSTEVIPSSKSD